MTSSPGRPRSIGSLLSRLLSVILVAIPTLVLAPSAGAQATQDLGRRYVEWFQARDAQALAEQLSDAGRQQHPDAAELERKVFPEASCVEATLVGESFSCSEAEGAEPLCRYHRLVRCEGLAWDTSFHVGMRPFSGRLDYVYRFDHRPPSLLEKLQRRFPWIRKWQKELLLALVMLVILATATAVVIGGQIRARRHAHAWVEAAEALGLGPIERQGVHRKASGTYREAAVTVGVTVYRHRRGRSTNVTYDPWVRVSFPATLGLGLELRASAGSLWRQLAAPFDTQRVETGNSEFDEMFTVRAKEGELARRLLEPPDGAGPWVAGLLLAHPDRDRIRIDDEAVTIRTRGVAGERAVRSALDTAAALARVLWEARQATRR
jgi:hypothetical protein